MVCTWCMDRVHICCGRSTESVQHPTCLGPTLPRSTCDWLASVLSGADLDVAKYHAGMVGSRLCLVSVKACVYCLARAWT